MCVFLFSLLASAAVSGLDYSLRGSRGTAVRSGGELVSGELVSGDTEMMR